LLAAPEIDRILGCHAHVVQPFGKINGKWVVYGMGNEVARHEDPVDASREGVMPRFTFTETTPGHWQITKAEVLPTWVDLTPKIRSWSCHGHWPTGPRPPLSAPSIRPHTTGSASTYAAAGPAWPACPWPGAERGRELSGGGS
jgi:hypothetical protein